MAEAHYYETTLNENSEATISNVWKANYEMHITLDGFNAIDSVVNLADKDTYDFTLGLTENIVKPYNLMIDSGSADNARTFIWNYADYYADDFEGHTDFTINSPGKLGWQYIDGDGASAVLSTQATTRLGLMPSSPWPSSCSILIR